MAKLIKARHSFRTDSQGKPKEQSFPIDLWNKMPKIHQWVNGEKIEHPKMGWVQIGTTDGKPAPPPLKQAASTAQGTAPEAKPKAAPTPGPVIGKPPAPKAEASGEDLD